MHTMSKSICQNSITVDGAATTFKNSAISTLYKGWVDFAGPFITTSGNPRKPTLHKTYACLFVCLSTRAVHIETCCDLATDTFTSALQRFIARRGLPTYVFSDNGTNFVGASQQIAEVTDLLHSNHLKDKAAHLTSELGIKWHFIPARAPHFEGLWEAGVCQMKMQLINLVGLHRLTFQQLNSILMEVEATLNSRPLLPIDSSMDQGPTVLTMGHFLVGRPLKSLPTHNTADDKPIHTLRR